MEKHVIANEFVAFSSITAVVFINVRRFHSLAWWLRASSAARISSHPRIQIINPSLFNVQMARLCRAWETAAFCIHAPQHARVPRIQTLLDVSSVPFNRSLFWFWNSYFGFTR